MMGGGKKTKETSHFKDTCSGPVLQRPVNKAKVFFSQSVSANLLTGEQCKSHKTITRQEADSWLIGSLQGAGLSGIQVGEYQFQQQL